VRRAGERLKDAVSNFDFCRATVAGMTAPISSRSPVAVSQAKTDSATKSGGPAADFKKLGHTLLDAAFAKNGLTSTWAPKPAMLEGANRVDVAPKNADLAADLVFTRSGEVLLNTRYPQEGRPEKWEKLKPSFIAKEFKSDIEGPRKHLAGPPVPNPDAFPHVDTTPKNVDGHQELYLIKGKKFLVESTPNMPPQWYAVGK
jgi:hypothetical protein